MEDARPDAVRQKLNYVLEATPPEATVLNGWSSGGAFRKPAFFFIHREAKEIMREADYQRLAAVLAERSIQPELIDYDGELHRMPVNIQQEIGKNYTLTGVGTLWRLKRG